MQYLDWLRGLAVVAMVLAHVTDSWTREAARHSTPYFTLVFIGGVASPLFLLLAGLASAMSAAGKARQVGHARGAAAAGRRGWEIFALGLVFRLQAQLLGLGPIANLFKVDMLNTMGLAIVGAAGLWRLFPRRGARIVAFAAVTTGITLATPLVRAATWLSPLPDVLEAYLRPAGPYAAFPLFPWAGFLFAGVMIGDGIDATRTEPRRRQMLQGGMTVAALAGVWLAWRASFEPALFPSARFWHDSPTFFFIRLGLAALLVPLAWIIGGVVSQARLQPLVTLGRSSLFVYWIHVEMVYGVVAGPLKKALPIGGMLVGLALMVVGLYYLVVAKNRWLERHQLQGAFRILAPVVR